MPASAEDYEEEGGGGGGGGGGGAAKPLQRKKSFRDRVVGATASLADYRKRNQALYADLKVKTVAEQKAKEREARREGRRGSTAAGGGGNGGAGAGGAAGDQRDAMVKASPQRRIKVIDAGLDNVFVTEQRVKPCRSRDSIDVKRPDVAFTGTSTVAVRWDLKSAILAKKVLKYELQCRQTPLGEDGSGGGGGGGAAKNAAGRHSKYDLSDSEDEADVQEDRVCAASVRRFFCVPPRDSEKVQEQLQQQQQQQQQQHAAEFGARSEKIGWGHDNSKKTGSGGGGLGSSGGFGAHCEEEAAFFECDDAFCTVPMSFHVQETAALFQGLPPAGEMAPLQFRVRAKSENGWGKWSKVRRGVRSAPQKQPAPLLAPTGPTSLSIRWDAPALGKGAHVDGANGRALSHELFLVPAGEYKRLREAQKLAAKDARAARRARGLLELDVSAPLPDDEDGSIAVEARRLHLWKAGEGSCAFTTVLEGYEKKARLHLHD